MKVGLSYYRTSSNVQYLTVLFCIGEGRGDKELVPLSNRTPVPSSFDSPQKVNLLPCSSLLSVRQFVYNGKNTHRPTDEEICRS